MKYFKLTIVFAIVAASLMFGVLALAQDLGMDYTEDLGLANSDPRTAIVNIVKLALTFLGIIAVVIILYGGFVWMTAAGDPGRVDKAKKILLSAIIGLIIILSAFLIVQFVIDEVSTSMSGCTPGEVKVCGCGGMGDKICQDNGTWGPCVGGGCGIELCCPGSPDYCAPDCSVPPVFAVRNTNPADGAINQIRNIKLKYTFNREVDPGTVDGASFLVTDSLGDSIPGSITSDRNQIIFTPDSECPPNPCNAEKCFTAGDTVNVEAVNGAGGILSVGGITLTCGGMGPADPCKITFTVGDQIDCEKPKVKILSDTQICLDTVNDLTFAASDDSGISQVAFTDDNFNFGFISPLPLPPIITCPGALFPCGQSADWIPPSGIVQWQPMEGDYSAGVKYTISAEAEDLDANTASDEMSFNLRPAHCCNDVLDTLEGEEGIDCGGECAACEGAACGVSLAETCGGGNEVNCDNSQCASGFCNCGGYGAAFCQEKGYSPEAGDECCICEGAPIINWITPVGGFCDGLGGENTPCTVENEAVDCAAFLGTCNTEIPNGAVGNFASIGGRNFGETPGTVYFSDEFGDPVVPAELASAANPNCGSADDMWNNDQIIVVVPAGADWGPLKVEEASTGNNFIDLTNDERGPVLHDFLVNAIVRPGLCKVETDDEGYYEDLFTLQGKAFSGAGRSVFFGNIKNSIEANNIAAWTDISVNAAVPNANKGKTSIFVSVDSISSNYLNYKILIDAEKLPVIDYIDPEEGPVGEYITIFGSHFGAYAPGVSQVLFDNGIDPPVEANGFDFPPECQERWWQRTYIVVKVPSVPEGDYEVRVTNSEALTSEPEPFAVTDGVPGPGLCLLDPSLGPVGTGVELYGDNFGSAKELVRFYNNKSITGVDLNIWENQYIKTKVPPGAETGNVAVSNGSNFSNGLPFTVGYCSNDSQCQAGDECCGPETYWSGLCRPEGTCSDTGYALTGFGWSFTTATTSSIIGTPCFHATTSPLCPAEDQDCSDNPALGCSPFSCTCQEPCGDLDLNNGVCTNPDDMLCSDPNEVCDPTTCFCTSNSLLSCYERSILEDNCPSGQFCGNSPGQCSYYGGGASASLGIACNDASCDTIGNCVADCSYDAPLNLCIDNDYSNCDLPIEVSDINGNPVPAYCAATSSDLTGRWQINTNLSCPLGWTRPSLEASYCYHIDSSCQLCDSGFDCRDGGGGAGLCAAPNQICPSGSECVAEECVSADSEDCECCCRLDPDPAVQAQYNQQDCCIPLECRGNCGSDRALDTDNFGLCSNCRVESVPGVADQAASDAACNCEGTIGKYCDADVDVNGDGILDGVCRDCSQLAEDNAECSSHDTVCCIDAQNSDYCRGGAGNLIPGDPGYCAYYDCMDPPNQFFCDADAAAVGTYSGFDACTKQCMSGSDICDLNGPDPGDCDGFSCFSAFNCFDNNPFSATCGFCCCNMEDDHCADLNPDLYCDYTTFGHCEDPTPSFAPDFGVCCGCETDGQCGDPSIRGCGDDTCCHIRPRVDSTEPADESENICRNALIKAEFNQPMDSGSFSGNIIVAGDYEDDVCPEGTNFLASNNLHSSKSLLARMAAKIRTILAKALSPVLPSRLAKAFTNPSATHNYCAIQGAVAGYSDAAGNGVMKFYPSRLLDGARRHYVIILGDEALDSSRGVKNIVGVGMNGDLISIGDKVFNGTAFENSYIWSFETLSEQAKNNGICDIDRVEIDPYSYLFTTVTDDLNNEVDSDAASDKFDRVRDSDKMFAAGAVSAEGQELSPVAGYAWRWVWSVDNPNIVDKDPVNPFGENDSRQLYEAQPKVVDGSTHINAAIDLTETEYSSAGDGKTAKARVQVLLCDNPWPPIAFDGTWEPWSDNDANCTVGGLGSCVNTNYELYYCRDHGRQGTYDDLPAIISDSTIIRGQSDDIIKEAYYFREERPSAVNDFDAINHSGSPAGGSVYLEWTVADPEIDGFKIYWGKNSDRYTNEAEVSGGASNKIIEGLSNGETYYFNITALYDTGAESEFFGEVEVAVEDVASPSAPSDFSAVPGDAEVTLSWTQNAIDTESYEVYYGTAEDVYGYSQNIGLDTEVIIAGLTNGKIYYFAVRAIDAAGNMSGYSAISETPQLP